MKVLADLLLINQLRFLDECFSELTIHYHSIVNSNHQRHNVIPLLSYKQTLQSSAWEEAAAQLPRVCDDLAEGEQK